MSSLSRRITPAIALFSGLAFGQPAPRHLTNLARAPLPSDPLEIVSDAQPVQDAQQRLDAIALLTRAHDLSNVRAQPYDLITSFTASSGQASDGSWTLEDIARGRSYKWTAQGPNYSIVQLYPQSVQGLLYGNQSAGTMPLRLAEVRDAIFFTYQMPGPQASVRTAKGFLNGTAQNCVLSVIGAGSQTFSGARNWEESEYCVDSTTGLLTTYSPVPGLFVHYDYAGAVEFHGKTIPAGFTISEGGRTVVEARTVSVKDPVVSNDAIFSTAGLQPLGVGRAMNPHSRFRSMMPAPGQAEPGANAVVDVVVLHGNVSPEGRVLEAEVIASSKTGLNQAALDRVNGLTFGAAAGQPGVTPQSREMYFTIEFVPTGE